LIDVMKPAWKPYREPIGSAALRNIAIAIVVGGGVILIAGLSRWPLMALLALWPLSVALVRGVLPEL